MEDKELDSKKKLEEMRHEQSREAYEFLYSYYTNIEPNKQKAFHWLKNCLILNVQMIFIFLSVVIPLEIAASRTIS